MLIYIHINYIHIISIYRPHPSPNYVTNTTSLVYAIFASTDQYERFILHRTRAEFNWAVQRTPSWELPIARAPDMLILDSNGCMLWNVKIPNTKHNTRQSFRPFDLLITLVFRNREDWKSHTTYYCRMT